MRRLINILSVLKHRNTGILPIWRHEPKWRRILQICIGDWKSRQVQADFLQWQMYLVGRKQQNVLLWEVDTVSHHAASCLYDVHDKLQCNKMKKVSYQSNSMALDHLKHIMNMFTISINFTHSIWPTDYTPTVVIFQLLHLKLCCIFQCYHI